MGASDTGPAHGPAALAGCRVWIDAQLPPALARWLAREHGVDAVHVSDLGYLRSDDADIFSAARAARTTVVVTKDDDFVRLLERHGPPPQIVWVTVGNVRDAALRELVLSVWPRVVLSLAAGEPLVELG